MKRRKDDGMEQFTPEKRIDDFLKKPLDKDKVRSDVTLTQEESKQLAREQVLRKQSVFTGNQWESFKDKVKRNIIWRLGLTKRLKMGKRFRFETLPLLLFGSVAIYVSWKMEDRLDQMKRKVVVSKTLREEEAERENKLIAGALSGEQQFEDRPISSRDDKNYKYRFEDDETAEEAEGRIVASPYAEYPHPDLTEEEMAKMMKQYEDRAAFVLGGAQQLPNPGYSTDPSVNRRNKEKYIPKRPQRE
jgi:hypothetical protein